MVVRFALAGLFIYAGVVKLRSPADFALEISRYELLPELSAYAAAMLPTIELTLGAGLLALPRPWQRASALGILVLMLVFTVAAGSAIARGLDIECGCFGDASGEVTWLTLGRDLVLVAMSLALVLSPPADAKAQALARS
jgi:uncharacterized membrane protein YphA (DoxX/SURF4 family)